MKKDIHYTVCGLEYVYLINAPVKKTKSGEIFIDIPMEILEHAIAKKILERKVPIRGSEVAFLRKSLGMTLDQLSKKLGITAAGLLKWERARDSRLSRINEAAVRSLCSELLKMPSFKGNWSELIASEEMPEKLELDFKKAA